MDKETDRLRTTQRYLAEQYTQMQTASTSALNISQNLSNTSSKYNNYQDKIDEGSRKVKEIQRMERLDELKLQVAFYFFLATAAYLFLKRFYLHELIALAYWLLDQALKFAQLGLIWAHEVVAGLLGLEKDSTLVCLNADLARKCWITLRKEQSQLHSPEILDLPETLTFDVLDELDEL